MSAAPPLLASQWSHTGFIPGIEHIASIPVGPLYIVGGAFWSLESMWSLWTMQAVCPLPLKLSCIWVAESRMKSEVSKANLAKVCGGLSRCTVLSVEWALLSRPRQRARPRSLRLLSPAWCKHGQMLMPSSCSNAVCSYHVMTSSSKERPSLLARRCLRAGGPGAQMRHRG